MNGPDILASQRDELAHAVEGYLTPEQPRVLPICDFDHTRAPNGGIRSRNRHIRL